MKAKVVLSMMLVSLLMLAGCSTVPSTSQVAGSHVEAGNKDSKIAKINRRNNARGIDTLWVNPPRQKKDNSDGS